MRAKTVRRGPPPKPAKKTTAKIDLKQAAQDAFTTAADAGPKYQTIGDVMRAKAKGALPRGAKFEIHSDRAVLVAGKRVLLNTTAGEVARWGLRKAGLKADFAA